MPAASTHRARVGGHMLAWREADPPDGAEAEPPVLYVHGVPTASFDWVPFLERTGGIAPDLIGFGGSAKPPQAAAPTIDRIADTCAALLDHLGHERCSLVVHDWGGAALAFAQRAPERIARLVIVDAVPLLGGYRWHRLARAWRTPGLGELVMAMTTRTTLTLISREANATPGPLPDALLDEAMGGFDAGTRRAILHLYRSAPPEVLAVAGARLHELRCRSLVLWGEQDPYIPARFADAYGAALGGPTTVERIPQAGHWPWLDRPELVERVADFLTGGR